MEATEAGEAPATTVANKATKKLCAGTRKTTNKKRLEATTTTQDVTTTTMTTMATKMLNQCASYLITITVVYLYVVILLC